MVMKFLCSFIFLIITVIIVAVIILIKICNALKKRFRYLLLSTFVFSFHLVLAQHDKIFISSVPGWVASVDNFNETKNDIGATGGYKYRLIDFQTNVETQERFKHLNVSVLNSKGIQEMSDLSFDFDPSFQEIHFHYINIKRDGNLISKLSLADAKVIQREQSAERFLYDGNLSVVFNLTDIRVGDEIDYAFTLKGFNPVYGGQFASYTNLNYQDPISKIHKRLLISENKKLNFQSVNGAEEPTITKSDNLKILTWEIDNVDQFNYDANVPIWYDAQQSYQYSEYDNWNDLVKWALPLFQISKSDNQFLKKELDGIIKNGTKESKILNVIRFVQDNVRYLGFESGLNTMKPYSPKKVITQRFGDCKDKSLLLVGLLRHLDVNAYPMLVHSSKGYSLPDKLPSPDVFNHCVVALEWKGNEIFIDPTIQNQGGSLDYISFPDYKYGLILKNGIEQLDSIAFKNGPELIVQEMINVKENGAAEITVRSEYYGYKADYIRSFFLSNDMTDIKHEYVNFYSSLFPNVQLQRDVKYLDYDRNSTNKIIVEEYYNVQDVWKFTEDSSRQYFEVNPLVLSSSINYPGSPERTMPYYTPGKEKFFQKTTVTMYEDWGISPINKTIVNEAFTYTSAAYGSGNQIVVDYEYESFKDYVSASQAAGVIADANSMSNDLSFYVYKNSESDVFKLSWLNVGIVGLLIAIFIYLIMQYDKSELLNPLPPSDRLSEEVFGGWLLLLMVGISVTPIYQAYSIFSESAYFNANVLEQLRVMEDTFELFLIIEAELVINMSFFLFSCYFVYCFFTKRTIVPQMAIVFYSSSFLIVVLDLLLLKMFVPDHISNIDMNDSTGQMLRSFVAAVIWIPYFLKSERVKKTFVRTPLNPVLKY